LQLLVKRWHKERRGLLRNPRTKKKEKKKQGGSISA